MRPTSGSRLFDAAFVKIAPRVMWTTSGSRLLSCGPRLDRASRHDQRAHHRRPIFRSLGRARGNAVARSIEAVLAGAGEAGKTSLLRRLRDAARAALPAAIDRTIGLEMAVLSLGDDQAAADGARDGDEGDEGDEGDAEAFFQNATASVSFSFAKPAQPVPRAAPVSRDTARASIPVSTRSGAKRRR